MILSPKNAPKLYTIMIQTLRDEWLFLFAENKSDISIEDPPTTIIYDDKIILDDTYCFFLIIPSLFFIISHVSPKYILSIGYHLSFLNVTFFGGVD